MKWRLPLSITLALSCAAEPDLPAANGDLPLPNANCEQSAGLEYICGIPGPEDLVAIPQANLVVASGNVTGVGIYYISMNDRSKL